ncbi:hypothetical protein [Micromonospora aurantiaca (nom. illeg.)]|uniref:hypothetical protein n=1 Tax=Micromonospora aurantiaca (nom. illeg.) TaxID=47850 RepID=UPI0011A05F3C|nr:hypothetical protein [Micromonospora aurantiaca]MBC9000482.1 hypothetical protein [Micromonospora aurantiaca]
MLLALIRATAIALGNSIGELADATDAAGRGRAAALLRRALTEQQSSAQSLAEAVKALSQPEALR